LKSINCPLRLSFESRVVADGNEKLPDTEFNTVLSETNNLTGIV
jgi:hypothetical protein